MLKQCLLVLLAASLISIGAPFAAAQSSNGGRHHAWPDPAERTQELTKKLKLNSDQQTKVLDILQSEHSQMESLHQDSSLSEQDRHAKMRDIRKSSDTQIRALLDSGQQKKWDEMQAKHEEWGHNHHPGQ